MIYSYLLRVLRPCTESKLFLLAICSLAIFLKVYFIRIVTEHKTETSKTYKQLFFLLGILIGSMFGDIAWVIKLTRNLFFPRIDYPIVTFFIRIAWGFLVIHYQSLSLFIESLPEKKFHLRQYHKIILPISFSISSYFFYIALFKTSLTKEFERDMACSLPSWPIEMHMMRITGFYLLFFLTLPSLYIAISHIRNNYLPRILHKQLILFTSYLMGPYVIIELLQAMQHPVTSIREFLFAIVGVSTLLLLVSMYTCIKKIMGLRFLNYSAHVKTTSQSSLAHDFKYVLERLSKSSNMAELTQVSQHFLHDTFGIPIRNIGLHIRSTNAYSQEAPPYSSSQKGTVEQLLRTDNKEIITYIKQHRILIYDEIEFSDFYEESRVRQEILIFLNSLNAELFIPIFNKKTIIAYIIVENHNRTREFYGTVERDEMIIFASYLNHVITLLQTKNINTLMQNEKELQEELYSKTQQINQHKETIRSFIHHNKEKKIGVIFYKNRRFSFVNKEAKELININLNKHEGHPLTKSIKKVALQVDQYSTPYRCMIKDIHENQVIVSGVHSLDKNSVIIAVYYPEVSDLLYNQPNLLKDPTKWDYLLYLESTQPGKLISKLIPGSGEQLLHFKVQLLKTALEKKATLLEVPDNDLMQMVEVLHHISLREQLHIIALCYPEKNNEHMIKIFGLNPLFALKNTAPALLKKLDAIGTLFIKNIHFLSIETQRYLAEYIRYGQYRSYRSDKKSSCNVRIIASTDQDLLNLVHNNLFSQELYNELKKTMLTMPSLNTLPEQELTNLAEGITEQAVDPQGCKPTLTLTEHEKTKLVHMQPLSIKELRGKIKQILDKKAIPQEAIYQETQFGGAYNLNNPKLKHAAQLGRQALRDSTLMKTLWNTFKNQNKIASFLGVNRSSVNRRCKQYNLK